MPGSTVALWLQCLAVHYPVPICLLFGRECEANRAVLTEGVHGVSDVELREARLVWDRRNTASSCVHHHADHNCFVLEIVRLHHNFPDPLKPDRGKHINLSRLLPLERTSTKRALSP